ncbi:MAG: hypothetical protein ABSH23_09485 [Steroidobacteraceae bacterium]|jgi:hypothetical protein
MFMSHQKKTIHQGKVGLLRNTVAAGVAAIMIAASLSTASAADGDAPATPSWQAGPVTLTFGGFTALESLYRTRYEGTDIGSDFNTKIPFPYQTTNYNVSEFRETARQSRLSILAQGPRSGGMSAEGYFELDFLGDAENANSNESNSYTPRIRVLYGLFRDTDQGFYFLAGQSWSLVTLTRHEMDPRSEMPPLTIDSQYVAGFNWTRNPQVRFVKSWNDQIAVGLSIESPQAQVCPAASATSAVGCNTPGSAVTTVAGTQQLISATALALDFVPDVVLKVAADPGYGHYELYGLGRGYRDRNSALGQNNTTYSGGVGGSILLPLVPSMLDFQASVLTGSGIGRYGSAQLPDVAVRPDDTLAAINETDALGGLVFKPNSAWTFYAYGGIEQASAAAYTNAAGTVGYGYGSPLYNNSGCLLATGSAAKCAADTKSIEQGAIGTWWKYYQGAMGNLQLGLQGSYTRRETFTGIGGDPSTNMTVIMASFRFYPYQR